MKELRDFVREQASLLNDPASRQMGFVSKEEVEPKFEILRALNRRFSLGIPEKDLTDIIEHRP